MSKTINCWNARLRDALGVVERVSAENHSDPDDHEDMTVPLAIECAEHEAKISGLEAENTRLRRALAHCNTVVCDARCNPYTKVSTLQAYIPAALETKL